MRVSGAYTWCMNIMITLIWILIALYHPREGPIDTLLSGFFTIELGAG